MIQRLSISPFGRSDPFSESDSHVYLVSAVLAVMAVTGRLCNHAEYLAQTAVAAVGFCVMFCGAILTLLGVVLRHQPLLLIAPPAGRRVDANRLRASSARGDSRRFGETKPRNTKTRLVGGPVSRRTGEWMNL
jgi:hypothetical protein